MKLFLVSNHAPFHYDRYESAVVAARTPERASELFQALDRNIEKPSASLIGTATRGTKEGVIDSNFCGA